MPDYKKMLYNIEVHSVDGIQQYFKSGGDPNEIHDGIPLFTTMAEMYTRTSRFKDCIKAFIVAGLKFDDKALLAVLADDADLLKKLLAGDQQLTAKKHVLFNNTYTPLTGGTLLHYCAEYNSIACAKALIERNADINAKAAVDENGFGGHTPLFHTVNQNSNNSADVMHLLLNNKADLEFTVKGLIWGRGYEWETFIPAVNPVSYAMMGSLPQMHRDEKIVAGTVALLIKTCL